MLMNADPMVLSCRIQILDCYSDPHGWKDRIMGRGKVDDVTKEAYGVSTLCKDVKDMDKLCSLAIELGKGNFVDSI